MEIKLVLLVFFSLFSSWASLVFSESLGFLDSLPCIHKLLPCETSMKLAATTTPPATCCVPLKQMLLNDTTCFCAIFDSPIMLESLSVTQEQALKLPAACNVTANISVCKKGSAAPTGSPKGSPTGSPSAPSKSFSESDSSKNTTASAPTSSAANGKSHFNGAGFIGVTLALVYAFYA